MPASLYEDLEPQIQRALGCNYAPERYIYRLVRSTEVPYMSPTCATSHATPVGTFWANGVAHSQLTILQIPRVGLQSAHHGHHKTSTWGRRKPNPLA